MGPYTSPLLLEILPTTLLATVLILGLYALHQHSTLKVKVTSVRLPASALSTAGLESLPRDLLDRVEEYRLVYYWDSIPLPLPLPPSQQPGLHARSDDSAGEDLFTRLMQRNMRHFSIRLPQAWLLRLMARTPEAKRSFSKHHIATLPFQPGNLVCGVYRVLSRSALRCEMGMSAGEASPMGLPGSFGGRLVTRVQTEGEKAVGGREEGEVLVTETLQWVLRSEAEGKGFKLPLERGLMRWMHELASWGLLVSGSKWLGEQLEKEAASDGRK